MHPSQRFLAKLPTALGGLSLVLFFAGALLLLIPGVVFNIETSRDELEYAQLRQQTTPAATEVTLEPACRLPAESRPDNDVSFETAAVPPASPAPGSPKRSLERYKQANKDFVAWLRVPGATIDYPVVRTDHPDYYLTHTFSGKESKLGTLFALMRTDFDTPSRNIAIYGHHIRSNNAVMFSPLLSYKRRSFFKRHQTIRLDTPSRSGTYQVFAVINACDSEWDASAADFASDQAFLDFASKAKKLALYDTGVAIAADDQLLTLITCDRSFDADHGRLIVMAVRQNNKGDSKCD